ncbi:hypothetical protein JDV02_003632 [Purpureocillium takamizusanense]|uniref:Uncharacterized protein n=1 Tax=Purpureocillium takamizusanense TaxID=2060973 RepID=A0A9Q8QCS2_9HYPO|nr:uncharacterized protein JDV02_003632 [Purpureocillium takamizusanense]UNI17275.1 hypothetical protein JDV02_003632 [Purpureocillium takamizusanense]
MRLLHIVACVATVRDFVRPDFLNRRLGLRSPGAGFKYLPHCTSTQLQQQQQQQHRHPPWLVVWYTKANEEKIKSNYPTRRDRCCPWRTKSPMGHANGALGTG